MKFNRIIVGGIAAGALVVSLAGPASATLDTNTATQTNAQTNLPITSQTASPVASTGPIANTNIPVASTGPVSNTNTNIPVNSASNTNTGTNTSSNTNSSSSSSSNTNTNKNENELTQVQKVEQKQTQVNNQTVNVPAPLAPVVTVLPAPVVEHHTTDVVNTTTERVLFTEGTFFTEGTVFLDGSFIRNGTRTWAAASAPVVRTGTAQFTG